MLRAYPVAVEIPVQWGDMDAYGHVNNAVFFRYFESARIAYLEQCGFIESYDQHKIGAILHSTECRFRQALRHPDTVLIGARAIQIEEDRFTMGYAVVSRVHNDIVAEGRGVVVSFDYVDRKKVPLPKTVRDGIARLEQEAGNGKREA